MRLGVLTSTDTRHRYFARAICARFPLAAVAYENTGYQPSRVQRDGLSPSELQVVGDHFAERARQERAYFGHDAEHILPTKAVRNLEPGELNSAATVEFFRSRGVDTILVYGTNLIKAPLLDAFSGRFINLHLGLSPYYRGTATNFYPLLNEEPQYVGATIHIIDHGIDTGPILCHARPHIVKGDEPHTIGCKTILAGIEAMMDCVRRLERRQVQEVPQWKPERVRFYARKDYHNRQVVELYRKLEDGLIDRYVDRLTRGEVDHPRLIRLPQELEGCAAANATVVSAPT